ncbi:Alpha/Beta hydrolase protein [Nemania abortiva]|nr:Alpha/Beta hydrolase protein [Nemania abortiva]
MTSSKPTVLFCPGGFHLPWVFDSVRGILSSRGFPTEATALLTVGATDRTIGMHDDAKNLRSVIEKMAEDGKEIILVGHSYGGLVASNAVEGLGVKQRAAEGKQGGILVIIYLSATVIPAGANLLADGFIKAKNPLDIFYYGVEPTLAKKAVEALKPMPSDGLEEESRYEPWNQGIDVGYVFTTEDRTIPISAQQAMASRFPDGYFSASIVSGHSPFFTNPDDVADAIQNALECVRKKTLLN